MRRIRQGAQDSAGCAGFGRVRRSSADGAQGAQSAQGAQDSAGRARAAARARARARARRSSVLSTIQNSPTCVGLLKEPQKFQIQFLELHVDFYIVDDTELRRARARVIRSQRYISSPELNQQISLRLGQLLPVHHRGRVSTAVAEVGVVDHCRLCALRGSLHLRPRPGPLILVLLYYDQPLLLPFWSSAGTCWSGGVSGAGVSYPTRPPPPSPQINLGPAWRAPAACCSGLHLGSGGGDEAGFACAGRCT